MDKQCDDIQYVFYRTFICACQDVQEMQQMAEGHLKNAFAGIHLRHMLNFFDHICGLLDAINCF